MVLLEKVHAEYSALLREERITRFKLYRMDVAVERHFSFGVWRSRQHGFLKKSAGDVYGWGEEIMSLNDDDLNLAQWADGFEALKGMTVGEAIQYVYGCLFSWGARKCEMAEMALLDLAGRLAGKPTVELLGLPSDGTVAGLFCVLERDLNKVREGALRSLEQHYTTHLKVKLYGEPELDCSIVRAAREVMGSQAYLVGDVNTGYRTKERDEELETIATWMRRLAESGLSDCEDPAQLTNSEWVELQQKAGALDLIPDYPMRPARDAVKTILPRMGRIYNIHPGSAGSIFDAIKLANKVRDIGGKLIIGDKSLIGPACGIWQQLAIGLGAEWGEALEKPIESDVFIEMFLEGSVSRHSNGQLVLREPKPGFGLVLDETVVNRCKQAVWTA